MAGERVLIIDDSDALRSLLESILPYAGYEVVSASTGRQGLKLVSETEPDVVLTDLELPDTSGLKVLEELNERGITIPTIMMTGYGSEGIAARALKLGVRDYLIKPFTTEEVLSSIERALSESRLKRENERLTLLADSHRRHIRLISAIGRAAASGLALDQFLQRIVEAGRFATDAEVAQLLLLDRGSGQFRLAAAHGQSDGPADWFASQAGDECLQSVLNKDSAVRFHAAANASIQIQTGDAVRSVLQVPLIVEGMVCGLLSVDRRVSSAAFDKYDELLLWVLADYASMALERANELPVTSQLRPDSAAVRPGPQG
jgi:two-component system NtrC family sensor kinase